MQIIVLGMHRSGTSMVARLLNMMGAYFAPNEVAMQASTANPKGHWEREDIRILNDDILQSLGMSWDNISEFDSSLLTDKICKQFAPRVQKIIFNLDSHRPWMIKDPRLCLLLPVWTQALEVPVCIYVYRNPIQVAQSLKKREKSWASINGAALNSIHLTSGSEANFPIVLGMALWEKYTLQALENSKDIPKVLVSYNNLINKPVETIKALYKKLLTYDIQGLRLPSDKEILAYIEPKLCREQGNNKLQKNYINTQQSKLVKAFQKNNIFELNPLPNLSHGATEVLEEYQNKLLAANKILVKEQEIFTCNTEIGERNTIIGKRDKDIAILQRHIKEANEEANIAIQTQATHYKNQLAIADDNITELRQQIELLNLQQQELQSSLNNAQQIIADKDQTILTYTHRTENQNRHIYKLMQWIWALNEDSKAVFNSLTWKSGNIFTQIILKLMFKKSEPTAQDHIKEMMENMATYQTQIDTVLNEPILVNDTTLPAIRTFARLTSNNLNDYTRWIKKYDTLSASIIKSMQIRIKKWDYLPLISIVMPTYNPDEKWLRAAIESVVKQVYQNWELCIADDASTEPHVRKVLEEYVKCDTRIKVTFRAKNGHISAASNTALELVTGEFIALLDHDDNLPKHALFWLVTDIIENPNAMLWYSDEDKINEQNERFEPYFKPDWNYDLFLSHNMISHLGVYRTSIITEVGGFREGYEGSQDYDLALRVIEKISEEQIRHIPRVLYNWRALSSSTASCSEAKPYAIKAAQKTLTDHLERQSIQAEVSEALEAPGMTRVKYLLPDKLPLVSLIIPTHNGLDLLRCCIDSIFDKTDYSNFEIIVVNNNSDDSATLSYLEQLRGKQQVQVIDYPFPFNYAAINNMAVKQANGEIIGLLNNDLEVINPEWLTEMVSHVLRSEVGIVGARLWYPNNTLQHGGVIVGLGGIAGHAHREIQRTDPGYFGRAVLLQNFSAVTAACMLIQKANFLAVGGLDADNLTVAFNDVDLCLKIREQGLRIVWTPYAELYHYESASRGSDNSPDKARRFQAEISYMETRWRNLLLNDPAYNPNLTLIATEPPFVLAWPPRMELIS